jgi:hypothetical protein
MSRYRPTTPSRRHVMMIALASASVFGLAACGTGTTASHATTPRVVPTASTGDIPLFCSDAQQVYVAVQNLQVGGNMTGSQVAAAKNWRVEAPIVGGQLYVEYQQTRQDLDNEDMVATTDDLATILGQCYVGGTPLPQAGEPTASPSTTATTSVPPPTGPSPTSTTTSPDHGTAPGGLVLAPDGLGLATVGQSKSTVLRVLDAVLPTPLVANGGSPSCAWYSTEGLSLAFVFGNFIQYYYEPKAVTPEDDFQTASGIGPGSTVAQAEAVYPRTEFLGEPELNSSGEISSQIRGIDLTLPGPTLGLPGSSARMQTRLLVDFPAQSGPVGNFKFESVVGGFPDGCG